MEEKLEQMGTPGTPAPGPKARPQRASVAHEMAAEVVNVEAPVVADHSLAHSHLPPKLPMDMEDAKTIGINMESITNMLESLRGRTDVYAMKCREGLDCDLQQLRIRRTQLKPL